ncbi:hypothetical protein C8J57DRAFT_1511620 [Mycena rebaudengoi]|nr:hypothetical protein C8J57DRAFT_1511620 [Mycena rebaudengoi]
MSLQLQQSTSQHPANVTARPSGSAPPASKRSALHSAPQPVVGVNATGTADSDYMMHEDVPENVEPAGHNDTMQNVASTTSSLGHARGEVGTAGSDFEAVFGSFNNTFDGSAPIDFSDFDFSLLPDFGN